MGISTNLNIFIKSLRKYYNIIIHVTKIFKEVILIISKSHFTIIKFKASLINKDKRIFNFIFTKITSRKKITPTNSYI